MKDSVKLFAVLFGLIFLVFLGNNALAQACSSDADCRPVNGMQFWCQKPAALSVPCQCVNPQNYYGNGSCGSNSNSGNNQPNYYCGDGSCNNGEYCATCASDCGSCSSSNNSSSNYCGNGYCSGSETCSSCSQDCGSCSNSNNSSNNYYPPSNNSGNSCSIPDGSSSSCDCDSDSECPSGYYCNKRSGWDPCVRRSGNSGNNGSGNSGNSGSGNNSGSYGSGVISINGSAESGNFRCGNVSQSQDACYQAKTNRNAHPALVYTVAAACTTVAQQVCQTATRNAVVGAAFLVGTTVVILDDYINKTFTYETMTVNGWSSRNRLIDKFDSHSRGLVDIGFLPSRAGPDDYDRACRDSFRKGDKYLDKHYDDTITSFQRFNSSYGIYTVIKNGKMSNCYRKSINEFIREVSNGRFTRLI